MSRPVDTLIQDLRRRRGKSRRAVLREIGALGAGGGPAAPALIALTGEAECRHAAVWALKRIGPPAVPALLDALNATLPAVRAAAVGLLGEYGAGDVEVAASQIQMLEDDAPEVRLAASLSLALLTRCEDFLVPPLRRLLADSNWEIREASALALRLHGHAMREALNDLVTLLADDNPRVRRAAALALQALDHEASRAVPALIDAVGDSDRGVRGRAVFALARIGKSAERAAPILIEAQRIHGRRRDWMVAWGGALTLAHWGLEVKAAIPALIEMLCGIEDNYVASELFMALDRRRLSDPFGPRAVTPPLHTGWTFMRRLALEQLLRFGAADSQVHDAIELAKDDRHPDIRALARGF